MAASIGVGLLLKGLIAAAFPIGECAGHLAASRSCSCVDVAAHTADNRARFSSC